MSATLTRIRAKGNSEVGGPSALEQPPFRLRHGTIVIRRGGATALQDKTAPPQNKRE